MKTILVSAGFDDFRSTQMRFLDEASKLGNVHVALWSDTLLQSLHGKPPKFSQAERHYIVQAVRYVSDVRIVDNPFDPDTLPAWHVKPDVWVVNEQDDKPARRTFCKTQGIEYKVLTARDIAGFPNPQGLTVDATPGHKRVIVTGCYDWFHSGHVRFFEEVAELGDLYVSVGNDANIARLKGEGHPLIKQDERRYVAGSIRYVKQCVIATGMGWLDAEPEIARIKPDIYAVNEDGDKPEKREFCARQGIRYVVLKRTPKEGLTRRSSTDLRGF